MNFDVRMEPPGWGNDARKIYLCGVCQAGELTDPLAITVFDAAHSDDEERWFTLGRSQQGTLLAVAHTYHVTGPDTARVRLISARPATRRERDQYQPR